MKPNSCLMADRLLVIRNKIAQACRIIKRSPEEIKLVAVSKGHDFALIKKAYDLGIRDFGESYAQEFKNKYAQASLENLTDIKWHFLGALQSTKFKIISQAHYVHSVDSVRHARGLSLVAQNEIKIFLQVNLEQAHQHRRGFMQHEIAMALQECASLSHLKIIGLMTIAPLSPAPAGQSWFELMHNLREQNSKSTLKLSLSMGMSQDFEQALVYGADYIRIGSELFGERA